MTEARTEKISVMLTPAVLRKLDTYGNVHHWSRSTAAAMLIEQGLDGSEPSGSEEASGS